MNVRAELPNHPRDADIEADIARIVTIWEGCRARFAADGPFLFGTFSIADAMYAPVVWRFNTYGVSLPPASAAWCGAHAQSAGYAGRGALPRWPSRRARADGAICITFIKSNKNFLMMINSRISPFFISINKKSKSCWSQTFVSVSRRQPSSAKPIS